MSGLKMQGPLYPKSWHPWQEIHMYNTCNRLIHLLTTHVMTAGSLEISGQGLLNFDLHCWFLHWPGQALYLLTLSGTICKFFSPSPSSNLIISGFSNKTALCSVVIPKASVWSWTESLDALAINLTNFSLSDSWIALCTDIANGCNRKKF